MVVEDVCWAGFMIGTMYDAMVVVVCTGPVAIDKLLLASVGEIR